MESAANSSVIDAFLAAGIIAKLVLSVLILGSVSSWAIIIYKSLTFRRVGSENRRFLIFFSKAESLEEIQLKTLKRNGGSLALILRIALGKIDIFFSNTHANSGTSSVKGLDAMRISAIERTLQGAVQDEMTHQERYLHVLATIGNIAPFIGLLGTVWGIMGAFQEIGRQGSANIAVVAPGVAEALVNTAAGLFVAIPAAVSYNLFIHKIKNMHVQLDVFASEVVTLVEEKMIKVSTEKEAR